MTSDTEANLKTDTSISTDKITTVTTDTSTASMKPVRSDDEKSLGEEDLVQREDGDAFPDLPEYTPPLRINTAKLGLAGSFSTLEIPGKLEKEAGKKMKRRKSDPPQGHRSGSRSPAYDAGSSINGGSSISSLEDLGIDSDFLTDKMGFLELDLKEQQDNTERLNKSLSNLPPLNERLSEETLDDCHAFTDLKREEGYISRGNSITTGGEVSSNVLEPLDEGDEEDEDNERGEVKIMNMQEILEAPEEDAPENTSVG
eukprot:CAMPEP_0176189780 /NCGR_PEP_ID=MMETSP0121_2-20121125/3604_1 /TAXON_ID=160619 /ORGANISM="Kryptoperidinium foliaceum, Strain CCMP 1326" /LENGTH=256 /DNA_ID=CAMNT_0017528391 /DNA_START=21 /DNA_END=787 /DNA_ORIENTATION=+